MNAKILTEAGLTLIVECEECFEFWAYLKPVKLSEDQKKLVLKEARFESPDTRIYEIDEFDVTKLARKHNLYPYGERKTPTIYMEYGLKPSFDEFFQVVQQSMVHLRPPENLFPLIGVASEHLSILNMTIVHEMYFPDDPFKDTQERWWFAFHVSEEMAALLAEKYNGEYFVEQNEKHYSVVATTYRDAVKFVYDCQILDKLEEYGYETV